MTEGQSPANGGRSSLLLGMLLIGVLLLAIVVVLMLRPQLMAATALPTPSFAPDIPGITPIDPGSEVADFTMTSSKGEPFDLSSLQGEYALMFFGYTHCPDFCPLTLTEFKQVKTLLGEDADSVNFIFITVDGERDTPEVLDRYVSRFDPEFIGLSPNAATLEQIAPDYGLYYDLRTDEGTDDNYPVDHSTVSYLIDAQGKLRAIYSYDAAPEVIADHVRGVMAGEGA